MICGGCGAVVEFFVVGTTMRIDPSWRIEMYHGTSYLDGYKYDPEGVLDNLGWAALLMGSLTGHLLRIEKKECADWWYMKAQKVFKE